MDKKKRIEEQKRAKVQVGYDNAREKKEKEQENVKKEKKT